MLSNEACVRSGVTGLSNSPLSYLCGLAWTTHSGPATHPPTRVRTGLSCAQSSECQHETTLETSDTWSLIMERGDSDRVVVVTDYLTNPYVVSTVSPASVNMSLARSRSMADRTLGPHTGDRRNRHNFVESLLKQSLPRRSSFSFGSKLMRRDGSFPFRLFKSKSSSNSFSDSCSSSSGNSCQSHKSTEEFWNQYKRNQPRPSFLPRLWSGPPPPQLVIKPVSVIHEKSEPPQHNSISL